MRRYSLSPLIVYALSHRLFLNEKYSHIFPVFNKVNDGSPTKCDNEKLEMIPKSIDYIEMVAFNFSITYHSNTVLCSNLGHLKIHRT